MFYFISRSPRSPPPPFSLLICSVSPTRYLETSQSRCRRGKNIPLLGRGRRCGEEWPPPPPPSSPLPVGTEILLWFQFWPTLKEWATKRFEKCVLTSPPHPHCTHHFKNDPRSLGLGGLGGTTRNAYLQTPGSFALGFPSLPQVCSSAVESRLAVCRVGLCVMCGFLFGLFFFSKSSKK